MPEYKGAVGLIPYGLPQFLDFEIAPDKIRKIKRMFIEEKVGKSGAAEADETKENVQLKELEYDSNEDNFKNPDGIGEYTGKDSYEIFSDRHLAPWMGQWLPVPFLRQSGDTHPDGLPRFRPGPTNWARAYITRVPAQDDPDVFNWRVVLAFDMQVEDKQGDKHAALTPDDVSARATCSLADKLRDNSWFMNLGWVDAWLKGRWNEYFKDKKHKRDLPRTERQSEELDEDPNALVSINQWDYLASYFVYLELLQKLIQNPLDKSNLEVRILNLSGSQEQAADTSSSEVIDVDLILDIGNSRTTGILVENIPGKSTDLEGSYLLQLRDLSEPDKFYTEPFETRLEFSKADFGNAAFSKRSGRRSNAFFWASPVRTGNEAVRLANIAANSSGASGMTSPKRYLWDQEQASHLWYFNRNDPVEREELISTNPICRFINNVGTPINYVREIQESKNGGTITNDIAKLFKATMDDCVTQDDLAANQPRFSRSSMMMFLFMELIQQALVTMNCPAQRYSRKHPDRPRRLRSIIFTLPPGMPFAEQRIYRRWANAAIAVLWDALGWKNFYRAPSLSSKKDANAASANRDYRMSPEIRCRWDEATCTQLVYLYNEINRNFQGDAHLFFEIMGRKREIRKKEIKPTLRVATIDIGGGTTDLSIITYVLENDKSSTNRITPKQEIRDGMNFGGDEVLRVVTKEIVCKAIIDELVRKGVKLSDAEIAMRDLFGKKSEQINVQNQRIQFLRLVAIPLAYQIMGQYEQKNLNDVTGEINVSVKSIMPPEEEVGNRWHLMFKNSVEFFHKFMENQCGVDFDICDLTIDIPCAKVDKVVGNSVQTVLNSLGEVINAYDCDILLLSGRPSCWNAVIRQVYAMLPVAPDRIIPMKEYVVGPWYRFADNKGRITDPKTTVVMGAILCVLAESSIEGFVFDSSRLSLISTARFIGQMDNQGTMPKEMVWFPNTNPDKKKGENEYTKVVEFSSPITIGFRQMDLARWAVTRCWRMEFANEEAQRNAQGRTPYRVKVEFRSPEESDGSEVRQDNKGDIKAKPDEPKISRDDGIKFRNPEDSPDGEWSGIVSPKDVRIIMRTIGKHEEDGCWMDTAVLF